MRDVAGKVAFITGAASGMGLGMAKAFTRAGMKVMMADIDEKRLQAAAADLKAKGADVDTCRCDITVEKQVFDAATATVKRFGKVNVLCNNAGVSVGGLSEELSQKDWDWVIAVNQTAVVYALRAFLPLMKGNGESGHVMATSSMAGLINAGAGWGAYNASKHAVVGMMEVLYSELKDTPLGVSLLCPGAVSTNILEAAKHRPNISVNPMIARSRLIRSAIRCNMALTRMWWANWCWTPSWKTSSIFSPIPEWNARSTVCSIV